MSLDSKTLFTKTSCRLFFFFLVFLNMVKFYCKCNFLSRPSSVFLKQLNIILIFCCLICLVKNYLPLGMIWLIKNIFIWNYACEAYDNTTVHVYLLFFFYSSYIIAIISVNVLSWVFSPYLIIRESHSLK